MCSRSTPGLARLPAGGSRIRTISPAGMRPTRRVPVLLRADFFGRRGIKPRRHSKIGRLTRDRWFESISLRQGVCKPPVPLGRGAEPEMASPPIAPLPSEPGPPKTLDGAAAGNRIPSPERELKCQMLTAPSDFKCRERAAPSRPRRSPLAKRPQLRPKSRRPSPPCDVAFRAN